MGLVDHFHLLFGVVVVQKYVDVRDDIHRDLMRENLRLAFIKLKSEKLLQLLYKLAHTLFTCAACRLVGAYIYALDIERIIKRLKNLNHLDS